MQTGYTRTRKIWQVLSSDTEAMNSMLSRTKMSMPSSRSCPSRPSLHPTVWPDSVYRFLPFRASQT